MKTHDALVGLKQLLSTLGELGSQKMEDVGIIPLLMLMVFSLLCSLFATYLYLHFYKNKSTGSQIHRAFPLLGVSITAIFICIQFSLPLSLGLLGALSIVRFRTPVKDPEEIGFVMLVISTSIACATFNLVFLGIILIVACMALLILNRGPRFLKKTLNDGMLVVTLTEKEYQAKYINLLDYLYKKLPKGRIYSISKHNGESVISYSFVDLGRNTLIELQSELKAMVDGVKYNLFFNQPGSA
ncbi:DUF4956 domain-containing protein [Candidatus Omnitrophota bacterium]